MGKLTLEEIEALAERASKAAQTLLEARALLGGPAPAPPLGTEIIRYTGTPGHKDYREIGREQLLSPPLPPPPPVQHLPDPREAEELARENDRTAEQKAFLKARQAERQGLLGQFAHDKDEEAH
jgi:hypothetical protein